MALKLDDLKDRSKYRAAVQKAAKAVRAAPVEYWVFEGFAFSDNKPGWLLLVGSDLAASSLVDAVKNSHAIVRSRGKCAAAGNNLEFLPSMGRIDPAKLKPDVGSLQLLQVKVFSSAEGGGTLKDLAALRTQRDELAKTFSDQKSALSAAQRKIAEAMFDVAAKRLSAEPATKNDIDSARSTLGNIERMLKLAADTLPELQKAFDNATKAVAAGRTDLSDKARAKAAETLKKARGVLDAATIVPDRARDAQKDLDALLDDVQAYQKGRKLQTQLLGAMAKHRSEVNAGRKALEGHLKLLDQPGTVLKGALAIRQSDQAARRLLTQVQSVRKDIGSAELKDTEDLIPLLEKSATELLDLVQRWVKECEAGLKRSREGDAAAKAKG